MSATVQQVHSGLGDSDLRQADGRPYEHIGVRRALGSFGAEILGVDVKRALSPAVFAEILDAFNTHGLVYLHDQFAGPKEQARFGEYFGELDTYPFMTPVDEHPNIIPIIKEPDAKVNFGGGWHTDTSYKAIPPKITMLSAIETPSRGGDTLFSHTALAFEAFSPGMQAMYARLRGVYSASMVHGRGGAFAQIGDTQTKDYARNSEVADVEVEHPLIRTHPVTGRKAIYCSNAHTARIKGMTTPESKPLIALLHEQATKPDFQTRLQWRTGTLAFWDNRCVWHYALNDYPGQRRHMHRLTIKGETPQ